MAVVVLTVVPMMMGVGLGKVGERISRPGCRHDRTRGRRSGLALSIFILTGAVEGCCGIEQRNTGADGLVMVETQELMHCVVEHLIRHAQVELAQVEKVDLQAVQLVNRNTSDTGPTSIRIDVIIVVLGEDHHGCDQQTMAIEVCQLKLRVITDNLLQIDVRADDCLGGDAAVRANTGKVRCNADQGLRSCIKSCLALGTYCDGLDLSSQVITDAATCFAHDFGRHFIGTIDGAMGGAWAVVGGHFSC